MGVELLLTEERSLCRVAAASRKRILQEISGALATQATPSDELFDGLMARERLGSTGLGEGVAIPHCRAEVEDIILCLATSLEPIDYEASDGTKVDIFVALIVPQDEHEQHLAVLATLAGVLAQADNRDRLRACESASTLCASLHTMLVA